LIASYILRGKVKSKDETQTRGFKIVAVVGSIALGMIVIGSVFYLGGGESLLRGIGAGQNDADISSGRLHFWKTSLEIVKNSPIVGAGFDAFGSAYTRFDTQSGLFRIENAHNEYLQVLAEGGIFGFACLAAFLFLLFKRGVANISGMPDGMMKGIAVGSLAACFGIAIHSFFDFPLRTPSNALFFFILVVLATTPFGERVTRTSGS